MVTYMFSPINFLGILNSDLFFVCLSLLLPFFFGGGGGGELIQVSWDKTPI